MLLGIMVMAAKIRNIFVLFLRCRHFFCLCVGDGGMGCCDTAAYGTVLLLFSNDDDAAHTVQTKSECTVVWKVMSARLTGGWLSRFCMSEVMPCPVIFSRLSFMVHSCMNACGGLGARSMVWRSCAFMVCGSSSSW